MSAEITQPFTATVPIMAPLPTLSTILAPVFAQEPPHITPETQTATDTLMRIMAASPSQILQEKAHVMTMWWEGHGPLVMEEGGQEVRPHNLFMHAVSRPEYFYKGGSKQCMMMYHKTDWAQLGHSPSSSAAPPSNCTNIPFYTRDSDMLRTKHTLRKKPGSKGKGS